MTSTPVQSDVEPHAADHETPRPQPDPASLRLAGAPVHPEPPRPDPRLLRQILKQAALCRLRHHRTVVNGVTGLRHAQIIMASRYIERQTVQPTLEESVELLRRAFRGELPRDLLTAAEWRRRFKMDTPTGPAPAAAFTSLWLVCCLNEIVAALGELYQGQPGRAQAFLDGPYRLRRFRRARSNLPDLSG